ncbi:MULTISPECIES: hypothetical protein [Caldanaerobacter]|jgi:hypothetical protein|uniref:Uncharacterized protein n=5 Tax=Caldanaerobacter subterraneus TaxID=911092 RepID=Q8RB87_CALS4|nr:MULTISPECIES: hypothetical protein [Caldanaerobacter]AAM24191.1 hypothetical protein TTE0935 [Caldanaerobacter subterraneus subsp. tengcongensis MB4]ERM93092.1 hypothetical protein O163_01950 [Caldanaerobacter subterraneus subsp. yonseiensis KB-1]MBE3579794.1 hypothetical protein [Caldanaerobacter subterraneus]MCS3916282.1 hypothetical protein [Caldanaerobacter subterraneus subsp. tengcongensis MB4]MDI3519154.1 hypothetical protein [Caldanaerobacter sp.]
MDRERIISEELKMNMEILKAKIKSDETLHWLFTNRGLEVKEEEEDWKMKYGREIIEIYEKLSGIVNKLAQTSQQNLL